MILALSFDIGFSYFFTFWIGRTSKTGGASHLGPYGTTGGIIRSKYVTKCDYSSPNLFDMQHNAAQERPDQPCQQMAVQLIGVAATGQRLQISLRSRRS